MPLLTNFIPLIVQRPTIETSTPTASLQHDSPTKQTPTTTLKSLHHPPQRYEHERRFSSNFRARVQLVANPHQVRGCPSTWATEQRGPSQTNIVPYSAYRAPKCNLRIPRSQREGLRLLVCQQIWRASRSPSSPTRRAALLPSHPPYKPPDPQRSHWHVLWYSPFWCSCSGVHLLSFRFAILHAQFGCSSPQIAARLSFRPLITYSYKPGLALEARRAPKLRLATSGPTVAAARNSLDYKMPLERLTPAPSGYPWKGPGNRRSDARVNRLYSR
jgi:hypothetical protein